MLGVIVASMVGIAAPMSVRSVPAETVRTTVAYDDRPRRLTLRCDAASRGICLFLVRDGRASRRLMLRPGTRAVVNGVSPLADVCARGRNPGVACDWTPVRGATS